MTTPRFPIAPMKGVAGDLPSGESWVYELKWDGMRIIAHIVDGELRLQSSNGRDVTVSFPELDGLAALGNGHSALVLDGEVVAFDEGRPSFQALQQRMHVADPAEARRRATTVPVVFVAFDVLWLDEHDITHLPLENRRTLLEQLVEPGPTWRICEQHHDDPGGLLDIVTASGLEGVMAKRLTSTYEPARRSPNWIKVKPRQRQEFVVGGWMSGRGHRAGGLGSLLLGVYDDEGRLVFAGGAGSGLTDASIREWHEALTEQGACPFDREPSIVRDGRSVHWCTPDHVVEIAFGEWPEGAQLRHPVVLGRRTDKPAIEVRREA